MSAMVRRYWTQQLGLPRQVKPPARIWRSIDLKGPLPRETVRALVEAIRSLPQQSPWPEVDDGWWQSVLNDRWLKRDAVGDQRLDQLPVKSLTFHCKRCGQRAIVKIDELIRMFGPERNVRSVGQHVLSCRDKRLRREGEQCPISYQA
jgi:hypothetical protein